MPTGKREGEEDAEVEEQLQGKEDWRRLGQTSWERHNSGWWRCRLSTTACLSWAHIRIPGTCIVACHNPRNAHST